MIKIIEILFVLIFVLTTGLGTAYLAVSGDEILTHMFFITVPSLLASVGLYFELRKTIREYKS